jgi:hypothetical protein
MDATTAVIQFIGIVLFSAQVPNDPGVHAILPRLAHAEHAHLSSGNAANIIKDVTGIEEHVAVIIYREEDRLHRVGGWRSEGTLRNGWEYVRLRGEQVQFLTNGANDAPKIPTDLPRVRSNSCLVAADAKPVALRSSFQSPYKGAAAVVDIPFGRLDVCATNTPSVTERVDTRLLIDTEGVLVIAATKTGERAKTIALDGDAVVYIANVPPYYLFYGEPTNAGDPHWQAYNEMLDTPCPGRPDLALVPQFCDLSLISESYKVARNKPPADFKMINSECSNTQWP